MQFLRAFPLIVLLTIFFPFSAHAQNDRLGLFLDVLQKNNAQTLEEAIQAFPHELKQNYTLLHHGHGLRGTSYQEPGVILFGDDGKFTVTFGAENQALGNELEILQFNDQKSEFELYNLSFPLQRDHTGQIIRPAKNPPQCITCHTSDPKMIWDTYKEWPGAYGSSDDFISPYPGTKITEEGVEFYRFQTRMNQHPRYRVLESVAVNKASPYRDAYFIHPGEIMPQDLMLRPNARLTMLAARLDAKRAARKMIQHLGLKKAAQQICKDPNFISTGSSLKKVDLDPFQIDEQNASQKAPFGYADGIGTKQLMPRLIGYAVLHQFSKSRMWDSAKDILEPHEYGIAGYLRAESLRFPDFASKKGMRFANLVDQILPLQTSGRIAAYCRATF